MNLGQMRRPWQADVGPEPLSPRALYLFLAGHAVPVPDDLRCARRRADLHAAAPIQHAAPGPDPAQRPGLRRDRPGLAARIVTRAARAGDRPRPAPSTDSCSAWAGRRRPASSIRWKLCWKQERSEFANPQPERPARRRRQSRGTGGSIVVDAMGHRRPRAAEPRRVRDSRVGAYCGHGRQGSRQCRRSISR